MSRSIEAAFEIAQERRRQIYLTRISKTTERFYRQFKERYEQMRQAGYEIYIPNEMQQLEEDLNDIRNLLIEDPEEAQDISFDVGNYIGDIEALGHNAVEQFTRAELLRREAADEQRKARKNNLMTAYFNELSALEPVVANFAQKDLLQLRTRLESGTAITEAQVHQAVADAAKTAREKAAKWKEETRKSNKKASVLSRLETAETVLGQEQMENQQQAEAFAARIRKLKASVQSGTIDAEAASKEIAAVETNVNEELVTEEVRREAVAAFARLLQKNEFTVGRPTIVKNGEESFVRLTAQRPSGKNVICQFDAHGKVKYKFDNYEGMSCLKDIETFKADLDKVYSIKLSDERVLWENPNRLMKDAHDLPTGRSERGNY